jgi:hypothetical protein
MSKDVSAFFFAGQFEMNPRPKLTFQKWLENQTSMDGFPIDSFAVKQCDGLKTCNKSQLRCSPTRKASKRNKRK